MKDYLKSYANVTPKFQEGGTMPEGGAAPEGGQPAGAQDPGAQLQEMLMQYSQSRDPQLAVAICDMLVQMMAAQQGGGGAAPAAQPAPMMEKGGKLVTYTPVFKKSTGLVGWAKN